MVRFQMIVDDDLGHGLDEWRRRQKDLPNRTEAIRRMMRIALAAAEGKDARR